MRWLRNVFATSLACTVSLSTASAINQEDLFGHMEDTASCVLEMVETPQIGTTGGEWAVIGLARSGYTVSQSYWDEYYATVVETLEGCNGILHERKYTEYARVALAVAGIGGDPTDVGGYNLLTPLEDYTSTVWQGINGAIWALIAADSGDYTLNGVELDYVDYILSSQLESGGWALTGGVADPDVTGMALQALSQYRQLDGVESAIQAALEVMSLEQDASGGFVSWGDSSVESVVQMVVALCALDIPLEDERFVKEGNSLWDALLAYGQEDGSFAHTLDGAVNLMATEQALYAMAALSRYERGELSLYDMRDCHIQLGTFAEEEIGDSGIHPDVFVSPSLLDHVSFPDVEEDEVGAAILELASRQIISGNPDGNFYPGNNMTRAELATIMVNGLGLPLSVGSKFQDVLAEDWFAPYVATAYEYGIVNGVDETTFFPDGIITRQEVAVMVAQAATLCGVQVELDAVQVQNNLDAMVGGDSIAFWARNSVAFCYEVGIWEENSQRIEADEAMTRGEITLMIYRLLAVANLL